MYSSFQLLKKYLHYYLNAANEKGHGVHSPFVFDFIRKVLLADTKDSRFIAIENLRKKLLQNETMIEVEDFGAGSAVVKSRNRKIKDIAASSLKQPKYARLLNRMISYYKTTSVLELGTSLGITTAYLASVPDVHVQTLEGASGIAAIAKNNFDQLGLSNISITQGNFDDTLISTLQQNNFDFIFIDGNHRKEPTLNYFNKILQQSNEKTIIVFDDIHWSAGMEEAWQIIQQNETITLSIDLFFIGIVFFRKEFKVKQQLSIRF